MEKNKKYSSIIKKEYKTMWQEFVDAAKDEEFLSENCLVTGYHFRHQFIGKMIKNREIQAMNSESPMLVVSQTGTGKSTFVLEKLLPEAQRLRGKLLILASRTALALQYKKEIAKIEEPDLLDDLSSKEWVKRRRVGDVEIWTYQAVKEFLNDDKLKAENFCIVVFDECHHFVQDAAFDKFTWETYSLLMQTFHHCRRIYLTATPEMVADEIINKEIWHKGKFANPYSQIPALHMQKFKFYIYEFESDYRYLRPTFFTEDKDVIDLIRGTPSDEKILICVDSKERGKSLHSELGEEMAEYIDAELKNNEKAEMMSEIIAEEKFKKKVLIVTSFLDVGVNLKDKELKKIIVYSTSKTHFIQSIGRKRKGENEIIDLYIKIPGISELKKLQQFLLSKYITMVKNVRAYTDENKNYIEEIPFPCYVCNVNGKLAIHYNGYSLINANFLRDEITKFIDSAEKEVSPKEGIAREYLRWLGLEEKFVECRWLGKSPGEHLNPLIELLEKYKGKIMDKDEYCQFRSEFLLVNNEVSMQKIRENRLPSIGSINKILKALNISYELTNIKSNPSKYKIERR